MIRDCNCEVGLNVKCVFRKSKHKIMQSNAGKIVYILTVLQLRLPRKMKFFRSALTSAAPIPEFGGNSLVFRMEEEKPNYRKLCWRLWRWLFSQTWITTSSIRIRCTTPFSTHSKITPILRFLVACSVQLGWSSIQSAFLLFPLNSGASIHSALSNLISGYSSTRLLYHLNTRKRT